MATEEPSVLSLILAEQRRALACLREHPESRTARLWLNDWFAEEVLLIYAGTSANANVAQADPGEPR